jgi:hypothetical protein
VFGEGVTGEGCGCSALLRLRIKAVTIIMSKHAATLAPVAQLRWGLIDLGYILTSEKHRRLSRKFVETPVDNT